jgi:hypothetical protein
LQVLNDPQTPPVVEFDRNRLADHRLGSNQPHLKSIRNGNLPDRLFGKKSLCPNGLRAESNEPKKEDIVSATHHRNDRL